MLAVRTALDAAAAFSAVRALQQAFYWDPGSYITTVPIHEGHAWTSPADVSGTCHTIGGQYVEAHLLIHETLSLQFSTGNSALRQDGVRALQRQSDR
jgi:hypothetical protein